MIGTERSQSVVQQSEEFARDGAIEFANRNRVRGEFQEGAKERSGRGRAGEETGFKQVPAESGFEKRELAMDERVLVREIT